MTDRSVSIKQRLLPDYRCKIIIWLCNWQVRTWERVLNHPTRGGEVEQGIWASLGDICQIRIRSDEEIDVSWCDSVKILGNEAQDVWRKPAPIDFPARKTSGGRGFQSIAAVEAHRSFVQRSRSPSRVTATHASFLNHRSLGRRRTGQTNQRNHVFFSFQN